MRTARNAGILLLPLAIAAGCRARSAQCNAVANDPATVVSGELGQRLDSLLTAPPGAGAFVGTVLVAHEGEVVLHKGYGCADRANGTPNTTRTLYDIGSLTRQFTAAAVLKLEEQGRLSLDDTIGRFIPNVPPEKSGITIQHLLANRSGLPRSFRDEDIGITREKLIELVVAMPMYGKPGARYGESAVGYSLLAVIIEEASGTPYETFLKEELFNAAGLERTAYARDGWQGDEVALGYRTDGAVVGSPVDRPRASDGPWWEVRGNAGLLSNPHELHQWLVALDDGKVLSRASSEKRIAQHRPGGEHEGSHTGYSWLVTTTRRNTRQVSQMSDNRVFLASIDHFIDERTIVIMATNRYHESIREARRELLGVLFPPTPVELPSSGERPVPVNPPAPAPPPR